MSGSASPGQPFIIYVYSDDDNDGTPEGFPKILTSRDNWLPLDGDFVHTSQLGYDETPGNPNNFTCSPTPTRLPSTSVRCLIRNRLILRIR